MPPAPAGGNDGRIGRDAPSAVTGSTGSADQAVTIDSDPPPIGSATQVRPARVLLPRPDRQTLQEMLR
jgi:hypothetical protein